MATLFFVIFVLVGQVFSICPERPKFVIKPEQPVQKSVAPQVHVVTPTVPQVRRFGQPKRCVNGKCYSY